MWLRTLPPPLFSVSFPVIIRPSVSSWITACGSAQTTQTCCGCFLSWHTHAHTYARTRAHTLHAGTWHVCHSLRHRNALVQLRAPSYLTVAEHLTEMSDFSGKGRSEMISEVKRRENDCGEVFSLLKLVLNSRRRRSRYLRCNIANTSDTVPIYPLPTWLVAAATYTCQPQRRPEYFLASSKLSVAKATAYFLLFCLQPLVIFIVAMLWNVAFITTDKIH